MPYSGSTRFHSTYDCTLVAPMSPVEGKQLAGLLVVFRQAATECDLHSHLDSLRCADSPDGPLAPDGPQGESLDVVPLEQNEHDEDRNDQ